MGVVPARQAFKCACRLHSSLPSLRGKLSRRAVAARAHELKHIDDAPVPKCLKNFTSLFLKMLPSRLACVTRRCWANPLLKNERGKDAKIVFLHTAHLIIE